MNLSNRTERVVVEGDWMTQAECLKMSRNQTNYCCTQTAAYYSTSQQDKHNSLQIMQDRAVERWLQSCEMETKRKHFQKTKTKLTLQS